MPPTQSLRLVTGSDESSSAEPLFATLYAELHRLARRELARRGSGVSLGATTLLHEAYLGMAARSDSAFPDRPRFMAYAARVMRGVIIDHVRSRNASKRGGQVDITSLTGVLHAVGGDDRQLVRISEALDELSTVEPELAEIVDLKFFCGFSFAEMAGLRGVSERTVQRSWDKARIYLHHSLRADLPA